MLEFLKATINDNRIMGADSLRDPYVWVNTSCVIHSNMRGHTGGLMSVGLGTIHNKSLKQKLNTRSTIEFELVGVSEYLPYDLLQVNFLSIRDMK